MYKNLFIYTEGEKLTMGIYLKKNSVKQFILGDIIINNPPYFKM